MSQLPPENRRENSYMVRKRTGVPDIMSFLDRQWIIVMSALCLGLAGAVVHVMTATPIYTSTAEILIEPKSPRTVNETAEAGVMQFSIDSSHIESQIEVLKSDHIAQTVFAALNLDADPEFQVAAGEGLLRRGMSLLGALWPVPEGTPDQPAHPKAAPSKVSAPDPAAQASARLAMFEDNLNVRRIGQSYVLAISFSSSNPKRASQIVNAVAAGYITDQIRLQLQSAVNGAEILQKNIDDLRARLAAGESSIRSGKITVSDFPVADSRVITAGPIPVGKSFPKTGLTLALAGGLALLAGIGIAAIREALDGAARSRQHIEDYLGIVFLGNVRRARKGRGATSIMTQVLADPRSKLADDVRQIQASLGLTQFDSDLRCIGITSCFPQEGKSTLASNLANGYAVIGAQSLLLDCDRYSRSRVSAVLQDNRTEDQVALRAVEDSNATVEGRRCDVYNATGGISDLMFERHGPAQIGDLLGRLRESYGVVLVDLPALSVAPDARVLAPHLDAMIIVVDYARTPLAAVAEAIRLLATPRGNVLGCVINRAPARRRWALQ